MAANETRTSTEVLASVATLLRQLSQIETELATWANVEVKIMRALRNDAWNGTPTELRDIIEKMVRGSQGEIQDPKFMEYVSEYETAIAVEEVRRETEMKIKPPPESDSDGKTQQQPNPENIMPEDTKDTVASTPSGPSAGASQQTDGKKLPSLKQKKVRVTIVVLVVCIAAYYWPSDVREDDDSDTDSSSIQAGTAAEEVANKRLEVAKEMGVSTDELMGYNIQGLLNVLNKHRAKQRAAKTDNPDPKPEGLVKEKVPVADQTIDIPEADGQVIRYPAFTVEGSEWSPIVATKNLPYDATYRKANGSPLPNGTVLLIAINDATDEPFTWTKGRRLIIPTNVEDTDSLRFKLGNPSGEKIRVKVWLTVPEGTIKPDIDVDAVKREAATDPTGNDEQSKPVKEADALPEPSKAAQAEHRDLRNEFLQLAATILELPLEEVAAMNMEEILAGIDAVEAKSVEPVEEEVESLEVVKDPVVEVDDGSEAVKTGEVMNDIIKQAQDGVVEVQIEAVESTTIEVPSLKLVAP